MTPMAIQKPNMVLFDYGQTLINERYYDLVKGNAAVLSHAVSNPLGRTAEDLAALTQELETEMERFRRADGSVSLCETHNHPFQRYLYESQGLAFDCTSGELERIFWDAAAPGEPTEGIQDFLEFLEEQGIRTGVISNLSFSGAALTERLGRLIPGHRFDFILATSEYVFRKPSRRIFELALLKAGLPAGEVWYCGDSPIYDLQGAHDSGLQPVWYTGALSPVWHTPGATPEVSHLRVDSWLVLSDLIKIL